MSWGWKIKEPMFGEKSIHFRLSPSSVDQYQGFDSLLSSTDKICDEINRKEFFF